MIGSRFRRGWYAIGHLCAIVLSLLLCISSHAQVGSATIQGVVDFLNLPVQSVEVVVRNVDSGYVRRTTTRDNAQYSIGGLAPGRYQLSASLGDVDVVSEVITLGLGQVAMFDLVMQSTQAPSANTIEEIVVTAIAPTDNFSSEVGVSLTPEMIDRLPQGNRNFLAFADAAPGVVVTSDSDGNIQFRGGAQRASAVNVFIDGLSQKDFVLGGGLTGQDSSRGNPFPQSAVAEYKVLSSNFKAEYDQIGSATVVAVSQRGTNEFHGGAFIDYNDSGLREKVPIEKVQGAEKAPTEQFQYGLWSSGPLIRDKLHYYVSYERKENSDLRELVPGGPVSLRDNLPTRLRDVLQSSASAFTSSFEQDLVWAKLNYEINESHALEFNFKDRRDAEITGIGRFNAPETAVSGGIDELRLSVTHEYRSAFAINKLSLTYEDTSRAPMPLNNKLAEAYSVSRTRNQAELIVNLGGGRDFQDKGQKGWGIQNDFTLNGPGWAENHNFKAGFKFKQLNLTGMEINPINGQVFYAFDATNFDFESDSTTVLPAVPYRLEFTRPPSPNTPLVTSDNRRYGLYIQDQWYASDRLVLDLGIRWDFEDTPLYTDYKTPSRLQAALKANRNINHPGAGYNVNRYINNGFERDNDRNAWQPRLGFSYVLTDNRVYKLFGGAGRSYNRVQFDFLQLELTRELFSRYRVNFSGPHQFDCNAPCIEFDPALLLPGAVADLPIQGSREVFAIDKHLSTPYSDQFALGIRADWYTWTLELGLRRTESKDGFVFQLGNRRENGLFYPPGATFSGAPFDESISPEFSVLLLGTNGSETTNNSFYFTLEKLKHDSRWGGSLTYTFSDAVENVRFGGPFDALDPQPGAFGEFPAAGVNEHTIVATLLYDLPLNIAFSAKLNLQSGSPFYGQQCVSFEPSICHPIQGYLPKTDFLFFRNAFAFRQVDMALSRNFSFGSNRGGIYVRADILNVFNHENFLPGSDRFIGPEGNPHFGATEGNIQGLPRTIKLSAGYNF